MLCSLVTAQQIPVKQFYDQDGKLWKLDTEINLQGYAPGVCVNGCVVLGFTLQDTRRVKILTWPPLDMDDQRTTLLHELQHVVLGKDANRVTTEHEQIYRLSKPLLRLLRDKRNADLVRWLFQEGQLW